MEVGLRAFSGDGVKGELGNFSQNSSFTMEYHKVSLLQYLSRCVSTFVGLSHRQILLKTESSLPMLQHP